MFFFQILLYQTFKVFQIKQTEEADISDKKIKLFKYRKKDVFKVSVQKFNRLKRNKYVSILNHSTYGE